MAQTVSTSSLTPQSFFQTTLSGNVTASDTTIPLNSLPTASEGYLVLESTSSTTREVIHFTSKTGSAVVCGAVGDRGLFGTTAQSHSNGALVEDNWVTGYWLDLQSAASLTSSVILQKHLANTTEGQLNNSFVSSGFGVTGISSSLVATLASGVAYVVGSRIVPAVGGHTYGNATDTFIDLKNDGTLTFATAGNYNSGASVALTANSIRVAKVQTHNSGINSIVGAIQADTLAATSTATGQVVDQGGNPIYPAEIRAGTLRQSADATSASTAFVNLPNLTLNITPQVNSIVWMILTADVDSTVSADLTVIQMLQSVPGNAALNGDIISKAAAAADRKTQAQSWSQFLKAGTSYTFIPQVQRNSGSGTTTIHGNHTALSFIVIPIGAN